MVILRPFSVLSVTLSLFVGCSFGEEVIEQWMRDLPTGKPVTDAHMLEFRQDFLDVDFNKDDVMDGQEVRAHFKDTISDTDLFHFFVDCDTDSSGTISLGEYIIYASNLQG